MVAHVVGFGCTPLPYYSPTNDPTPINGCRTGRPTVCPAPKELAAYTTDKVTAKGAIRVLEEKRCA